MTHRLQSFVIAPECVYYFSGDCQFYLKAVGTSLHIVTYSLRFGLMYFFKLSITN